MINPCLCVFVCVCDLQVNAAEALKQDEAEDLLLHNDGVLGRRLIYFHHIIANGKRQAISEWAVQLRLVCHAYLR